jgi:hypothetical protein
MRNNELPEASLFVMPVCTTEPSIQYFATPPLVNTTMHSVNVHVYVFMYSVPEYVHMCSYFICTCILRVQVHIFVFLLRTHHLVQNRTSPTNNSGP